MAVAKLTKSGNAVLFIDDFGNVFMTSKTWLNGLMGGGSKKPFILLKRLPDPVSLDRFMKSPVLEFMPDGSVTEHEVVRTVRTPAVGSVPAGSDALSNKAIESKENEKVYSSDFIIE